MNAPKINFHQTGLRGFTGSHHIKMHPRTDQRTSQTLPKRASLALRLDRIGDVKIDLPDEYVPLIINALEHYFAFTHAKQAAEWFKRKRPGAEEPVVAKRTGGRRRS